MGSIIDLQGKNIIVTGAGSGIGRETSIVLAREGATVIMMDISAEGLTETASMGGEQCHSYPIDLTEATTVAETISKIVNDYGKLDGLVHCAGISSRKPLNVLSKEGFEKILNVNFYAFVDLVKAFAKKKYSNDGGSVVVMSSISSIRGYKAKSEYNVSKAAVDAFVRCMSLELASRRIRVNSIMPGEVLTPMAIRAKELAAAANADEYVQPLGATHPYEVANLIAFLLSDATKTISGTSVRIDGGACV
jgi:NAD(P)-dependent dehydrogenase (short-subunit alcohol dehydrogenase family)